MGGFNHGHALIIGIANYLNVRKLPATVLNDAEDMCRLLCSPGYCAYPEAQVQLLLDHQATRASCQAALARLAQQARSEDTVLIYFSGHGGQLEDGTQAGNYLLPYDFNYPNFSATAISGAEISEALSAIHAQKLIVIFDCCHAGGIGDVKSTGPTDFSFKTGLATHYYELLAQGRGRVIIASSRDDEYSLVLPGMANSLFTHYLLEGMRGQVHTQGDGVIRIFELFDYVSRSLEPHRNMHPVFKAHNLENNFPVALYLAGKTSLATQRPAQPETVRPASGHYTQTELRGMLLSAFSEDELMIFCKDQFPEVVKQFSSQMSLLVRADVLVAFCQRHGLQAELGRKLQTERPGLFDPNHYE